MPAGLFVLSGRNRFDLTKQLLTGFDDLIRLIEMRDMAAIGKDHLGCSTADFVADDMDLLVAAELVVIPLNDQNRAGDVGQFIDHVPVAERR